MFPNCKNTFYYNQEICGAFPRYQADTFLAMWDILFNGVIPIFLIGLFSLTLLLRVIIQKRSLGRQVEWRRNRKMITQLLSFSSIYLFFNLPLIVIVLAQLNGNSSWTIEIQSIWSYSSYFVLLLQPFVARNSLPDVGKKLKKLLPKLRRQTVVPLIASTTNRMVVIARIA